MLVMKLARYEGSKMGKRRGGRGSKYSDDLKRRLVAESRVSGVSVPMVARRHGVPENRIYAWRADDRYQGDGGSQTDFVAVDVMGTEDDQSPDESAITPGLRIEVCFASGHRLVVSEGAVRLIRTSLKCPYPAHRLGRKKCVPLGIRGGSKLLHSGP